MNTVIYSDKDFDGFQVGIFPQKDGTFLAMTATWSKCFKTYKGAEKALNKRVNG